MTCTVKREIESETKGNICTGRHADKERTSNWKRLEGTVFDPLALSNIRVGLSPLTLPFSSVTACVLRNCVCSACCLDRPDDYWQTNGSEFNANRVAMRTAQHLSSIRQRNSGLSPEERETLGDGYCSFQTARTPAAGWYNGNFCLSALDSVRDTTEDSMSARKTAVDTNLLNDWGKKEKKSSF